MKSLASLIFVLLHTFCQAQNGGVLLEQRLVADLSDTPIYPRLTESVNGQVGWKAEFKYIDSIEIYQVTYLSDGLKVKGLMAKPKRIGEYPCIIFNRGGNRELGALDMAQGVMLLGQLAKEGYVVIASHYRGNGGSEGKEEFGGSDVNDVLILPEVLKEVEGADCNKIGMYGWSRGGMMTYIALTKTDKIKAAVVGGAVSDSYEIIKDRPDMETLVMAELIPKYYENKEAELYKRSALKWADKFPKNVPILVLHGNADWRVKPEQSLKMTLEFDKNRIPYRLIMFEGGDHGLSEHKAEVNEQVLNWFNKYLKNGASLPNMEYHGK